MILLILILNLVLSLIVLQLIKDGKIVKYNRILKYLNMFHIIALCLLVFFDLCMAESRGGAMSAFLLYVPIASIVFIFNISVLLLNRFFR